MKKDISARVVYFSKVFKLKSFLSDFEKEVREFRAVKAKVIRKYCQQNLRRTENAAWLSKGAENNRLGKPRGVLRNRGGKVSYLFGIIIPYSYIELKIN